MIGCLKAWYKLKAAAFKERSHCNAKKLLFSWIRELLGITASFLSFFLLFFLLEVLILDFFAKKLSSSRTLLFPLTMWELFELENSGNTLLPAEFSSTKPHDSNCIAGSMEKSRKIVSICKLVNASPPSMLPHIPPKAIANQDNDWRSPANEALIKCSREILVLCYKIINNMY